jgi:hypothetical protein
MESRDPREALIDRLVADAPAVRRRWSPGRRLALWLGLAAACVGAVALSAPWPLRDPSSRPPGLALELVLLGMATAALAGLALRAAVPGREPGRWPVALAVALAMSSTLCWLGDGSAHAPASMAAFIAGGVPCTLATAAYALLPTAALLWALRRGAPLEPIRTGVLGGSAGLLVGYLIMRIACSNDDPAHILTWHGLAVGLGIAACVAAGAWWLPRWRGGRL